MTDSRLEASPKASRELDPWISIDSIQPYPRIRMTKKTSILYIQPFQEPITSSLVALLIEITITN